MLLSEDDKAKAPCIYKALQWAQQAASCGKVNTATSIQHEVFARIKAGGGEVEYVEVRSSPLTDVSYILTEVLNILISRARAP